ncbi:MAG TPA: hypothetical protein PK384_14095, partial [Candidatus Latescibacteria bacterium]|nr:hypothetical protein [Candidatus Latescibacterota bacterium]
MVLPLPFLDSRLRGNDVIGAGNGMGRATGHWRGCVSASFGSLSRCYVAHLLVGQAFLPAQGGRGTE